MLHQTEEGLVHVEFFGNGFIEWLVSNFGYTTAMILKNLIIFASGSIFMFLACLLLFSAIRIKLKHTPELEGISLMYTKVGKNRRLYYEEPKNNAEALESFIFFILNILTRGYIPIYHKHEKRSRFLLWLWIAIMVFIFVCGVMLTLRVVT